jgi:hypothetical protein
MSRKRRRGTALPKAPVASFQSRAVTSSQNDIADVKARLARAESERDRWRGSGVQEKYLDSRVEALELQLDGLRQAARRSNATNEPLLPAAGGAPGAEGERERLMAELSIAFNGRHYYYDRYRYDRLVDAASYARLHRSGGSARPMPLPEKVESPSESQRELMSELGITFRDGVYHLGPYRYDRLADAVEYARRGFRA